MHSKRDFRVKIFCVALSFVGVLAFIAVDVVIVPVALAQTGSSLFSPAVTYDSGGCVANSLALADLNGDGNPDIVVGNLGSKTNTCGFPFSGNGSAAVLLGDGKGAFRMAGVYDPGAPSTHDVMVADLNGDQKPDVIVLNECATACSFPEEGAFTVLLGNGDGTLQSGRTYSSGGWGAASAAVADLNGDGRPDLAIANTCKTNVCFVGTLAVSVLLGNGDGSFEAPVNYDPGTDGADSIAVADLNHDGLPDLIVGTMTDITGVLLGNGDGTFRAPAILQTGGTTSLLIADLNGDSDPDVLINYGYGCNNEGCVKSPSVVLLGNGDGSFQSPIPCCSDAADVLAVSDVNGDGKPDAVSRGTLTVGVLIGNGDGTFQPSVVFDSGGQYTQTALLADVNGDGKPDLLVGSTQGNGFLDGAVSVLLNNNPLCTTPPAVTLSVAPTALWPPNGQMVPVTVAGTITDTAGCTLSSASYAVTDEYGTVQPRGSITVNADGAYSFVVALEAVRLGSDLDGRLYSVNVSATNNGGKAGSQTGTIVVPHDQRR